MLVLAPDSIVLTPEFRTAIDGLTARLGSARSLSARGWSGFAAACGFDEIVEAGNNEPFTVVGPPAHVLRHARSTSAEFGFVAPDAQLAKWWQRQPSWRDDTTLELWALGWSLLAVDRILVSTGDVSIEFAIGNLRPTPASLLRVAANRSALDDTN